MGRRPTSDGSNKKVNKGAWTALEDKILTDYVTVHGDRRWSTVAREAGLSRCAKSCRLRWLNYLRPDIKRGNITEDEEDLIIRLHKLLGNRWSLIAGRLPGRTDNEIKNYWHTNLSKKDKARRSKNTTSPNNERKEKTPRSPDSRSGSELGRESDSDHDNLHDNRSPTMSPLEGGDGLGDFKSEPVYDFGDIDPSGFNIDSIDFSMLFDYEASLLGLAKTEAGEGCLGQPDGFLEGWSSGFASQEDWIL